MKIDPMSQLCMTLTLLGIAVCFHIMATADDVDNGYRFGLRAISAVIFVVLCIVNGSITDQRNKRND